MDEERKEPELNPLQVLARDAIEWMQQAAAERGLEVSTTAILLNGDIGKQSVFAVASTGFLTTGHLIDHSIASLVTLADELKLPNVKRVQQLGQPQESPTPAGFGPGGFTI